MRKNSKQLEELNTEFVHFVLVQLSREHIDIKDESLMRDLAVVLRIYAALIKRQFSIPDPIHSDMALLFQEQQSSL